MKTLYTSIHIDKIAKKKSKIFLEKKLLWANIWTSVAHEKYTTTPHNSIK